MTELDNSEKLLLNIKNRDKIKIILHVGTPKTGTTSIQQFLYLNQNKLMENGFYYPPVPAQSPKHQWMVNYLLEENFIEFANKLKKYFHDTNESVHTIILSSEGIFNHWYDFSEKSKEFLQLLSKYFMLIRILPQANSIYKKPQLPLTYQTGCQNIYG